MPRPDSQERGPQRRYEVSTYWVLVLILIHIVGVGGAGWVMARRHADQAGAAAVESLGQSIQGFATGLAAMNPDQLDKIKAAMAHFNRTGRFEALRAVTDDGVIISSTFRKEVGTHHWKKEALLSGWPRGRRP